MNKKHLLLTALLLSVTLIGNLTLTKILFSQDKVMPLPNTNYYSLSSIGSTNNPIFTNVPPGTDMPQQEQVLLSQLRDARRNGDVVRAEQMQKDLDKMLGITPSQTNPISNGLPVPVSTLAKKQEQGQPDYVINAINTGSDPWSVATCTNPTGSPNAGRIWAAYTGFSGSATDTFKLAYSDNGGSTWTLYTTFNYGTSNVKFRSHELNIIPVYDGTNISIWGVAGYTFSGNNYSALFRYNITTSTFYYVNFIPPGLGYTYNPRITTDNSVYPNASTYVYVIASLDSTYASTSHITMQKYAVILNPTVASPTVTYRGPNTANGSFWWNSSGLSAGQYLSSDIAYYADQGGTGLDRIMTVYNLNNGGGTSTYSLYLAWTDDYGATHTGAISLTETSATRGARLAFNGGTANRNGMIVYLRDFSGPDWDVAYQNTTNGGTLTSGWTMNYIDFTGYYASGQPDVMAVRSGANLFKATYSEDSLVARGYFSGFNGTSWSAPSRLDVTGSGVDTTYACIVAGYKLGGGDDGIAIYSTVGGTGALGVFCTKLFTTTTGIHNNNNEIPNLYSLSQNYPNPFNPTTEIKFDIPTNGQVKLVIYDINGKEVTTLLNEQKQAGSYSVSFNASSFASGVYFYKLTSGSFTDTKKMALVK